MGEKRGFVKAIKRMEHSRSLPRGSHEWPERWTLSRKHRPRSLSFPARSSATSQYNRKRKRQNLVDTFPDWQDKDVARITGRRYEAH